METLIERLMARGNDLERATDDGHTVTGGGKLLIRVAAPPATEAQVATAEERLGFRLPDLLRQVYQEVGNGGFGPGRGLFGLPPARADTPESVVGRYTRLRQARATSPWPAGLIPICEWGSGIASCLDCTRPEATVVRLDPNMPKGDVAQRVPRSRHYDRAGQVGDACWVEAASLAAWLEAWVDGKRLFYLGYGEPDSEDTEDDVDEDDEEE